MQSKVLITGGAGFIGCNLAKRLYDEGNRVYIMDNLSRGKRKYLQDLGLEESLILVDLRNYSDTCQAFNSIIESKPKKTIHSVFHCASRIGGMQFLHGGPDKEFHALSDNLAIDRNVFRCCQKHKVKNIVFTSSVSVYNTQFQYDEKSPPIFSENDIYSNIDPEGGYGWGKYIGEKQLDYLSLMGHKVGIARIFKSYGPYDDYSPESGQVVLSLMRKILEGQNPLEVWGDGKATRNLFYIEDLVDGLIKLQKYPESLTVNFGSDKPVSIKELAEEIVLLSSYGGISEPIKIKYGDSKQNGPSSRAPNIERAYKKLQWLPKKDLREGIKKTWGWMLHEFS